MRCTYCTENFSHLGFQHMHLAKHKDRTGKTILEYDDAPCKEAPDGTYTCPLCLPFEWVFSNKSRYHRHLRQKHMNPTMNIKHRKQLLIYARAKQSAYLKKKAATVIRQMPIIADQPIASSSDNLLNGLDMMPESFDSNNDIESTAATTVQQDSSMVISETNVVSSSANSNIKQHFRRHSLPAAFDPKMLNNSTSLALSDPSQSVIDTSNSFIIQNSSHSTVKIPTNDNLPICSQQLPTITEATFTPVISSTPFGTNQYFSQCFQKTVLHQTTTNYHIGIKKYLFLFNLFIYLLILI